MTPRLSVVVPFYGVEAYIGDCLASIRDQALRDVEVLLVDDGSPDGSRAVADRFAAEDPRFRVLEQPNAGLGPARNTGTTHARGEYLAFVDSDDLVTRHGFERMVDGLDRSGSSFAGGNAMRFNNSAGERQSWTHRLAFAAPATATHITELPALARDRMVWNKVYRRSFWDEFGCTFPDIRYEDYPVTLAAHLDAVTVDVLASPVYYWRERESGDSITQHAYHYDNLLDRVASAEMVLALLPRATPAVRREVLRALVDADFVTVAQSFATVPEDRTADLVALGRRLAEGIGADAIAGAHPYDYIQYRALQAGDVPLLRELARYRAGGGLRGHTRGQAHPRLPWRREYPYPGLGAPSVPRRLYAVPRREVALRTTVSGVSWQAEGLRLRGTAEVRHVRTPADASVRVEAGAGSRWQPVAVRRFPAADSHGDLADVGVEVVLPTELLRELADGDAAQVRIRVRMRVGHLRRTGHLGETLSGSATHPPGAWVTPDVWAQPARTSAGHLVVTFLRTPWILTDARVSGGSLEVAATSTSSEVPAAVEVMLAGTAEAPEVGVPGRVEAATEGSTVRALLPIASVLHGVDHDDPFSAQTVRAVQLRDAHGSQPLVWGAGPTAIGSRWMGTHLVRVTRSPANRVNLVEGPLRVSADAAALDPDGRGDRLRVSGPTWGVDEGLRVAWRHYLPDSDDFVEAASALRVHDGRWVLSTAVEELLGRGHLEDVDGAGGVLPDLEWVLFFGADGAASTAVVAEPFLSSSLPLVLCAGGRRGELRPRGVTIHLETTDE
ncbi:MAG TPA: glycosyltransferase family 2 protein [Dermatophilaceae bacterium]|nr:glycosyltransferase family 2 protein [Dermatophilaceae bacterium]